MKTERHGSSQIVMKVSSQYLFSHRLVVVMCLLLRAGKLRSPLPPHQRRGGKVSLGRRDLWPDANTARSPNANRLWPVVT